MKRSCSSRKLAAFRLDSDVLFTPGHPLQNGRHERMHLTLKEATKSAAANVLPQPARFDDFITCFNRERPRQALGMKVPADVYTRSSRVYRGLEELTYPFHDCDLHRHPVRPDLFQGTEGQSQPRFRWPEGRRAGRTSRPAQVNDVVDA